MRRSVRIWSLVGFALLILAAIGAPVVRWLVVPGSPTIDLVDATGRQRTIGLQWLQESSQLCRRGSVQNQFGNWRDEGEYCGVLLIDLLGEGAAYGSVTVVAKDGYRVEIERERVEDPEYPVVLAISFDGRAVPAWPDGYRIVVLPNDGGVSNAEYSAESAGSYWVRNVVRLVLNP